MFRNLRIGARLISGFLLLSILGAIVAAIGILNMGKIHEKTDDMYYKELLGLSYIKEANINLIYLGRARGNYLLATTEAERAKQLELRDKYIAALKSSLEKAKPLFVSDKARELFREFDKTWADYEKQMATVYALAANEKLAQQSPELVKALQDIRKDANILDDFMGDLSAQKEERAKRADEEAADLYHTSRAFMIVLTLVTALAGLGLGILITRSVTRPLNQAVGIAKTVAAGDLTSRIEVTSTNEIGELMGALKHMNESLVRIVEQVRSGTDTIATASGQIASGNMDLSSRTEQQAGSLEETASSMEELTSTVKQNADNARQANGLAQSASAVAIKGGAVVQEVVSTMGSINESSKKIVDIITVIDSIAFQTNILALNAAVEAARAGEQGRGFAVVASEVRNLAQRSAAAAKEIKTLIGDSVEKVESGTKLVDQAGGTMQEIVESIRRVTDIMGEITAASQEQTSGIEQINVAIAQMDETTQQNASLVEEAAAAAQSLQHQAGNLLQLVGMFKLDGGSHGGPAMADFRTGTPAIPAAKVIKASAPSRMPARRIAMAGNANDWEEF